MRRIRSGRRYLSGYFRISCSIGYKRDGICQWWDGNGRRTHLMCYIKDKKHGKQSWWNTNGTIHHSYCIYGNSVTKEGWREFKLINRLAGL